MKKGDKIYVVRWWCDNDYITTSHKFFNNKDSAETYAKENWENVEMLLDNNYDSKELTYVIECATID